MTKPTVKLVGDDSNIFNLMSIAHSALVKAGMKSEAIAMTARVKSDATNYDEALSIIQEFVEVE